MNLLLRPLSWRLFDPILLLLVLISFDVSFIISLSPELSFRSTLIIDAICKFALHLIYLLVNSDYVHSAARFLRLHATHIAFTAITEVASSLLFQTVVESIIIQHEWFVSDQLFNFSGFSFSHLGLSDEVLNGSVFTFLLFFTIFRAFQLLH